MPIYSPRAGWIQGQSCTSGDSCLANPSAKHAWNGTWHGSNGIADDAPPRTIDLSFEGNSIGIYCILPQGDGVEMAVANITFELDGELVGRFFHDPDVATADEAGNHDVQYHVEVYQNTSIAQGRHRMRINSIGHSRIIFDYALYTTESDIQSTVSRALPSVSVILTGERVANVDSPHPSTTHPQRGVIVGAAVGGAILLIALVVVALVLLRQRRRARKNPHRIDIPSGDGRRAYGKRDSQSSRRSIISSTDSVTLENGRPPTPFFPFDNYSDPFLSPTSMSRLKGDHDRRSQFENIASPTDVIPLAEFPASPSMNHHQLPLPRIVVTGAETHLIGPDNAMTRFARQETAEREAELTRRTDEMEAAPPARHGGPLSPVMEASLSLGESGV